MNTDFPESIFLIIKLNTNDFLKPVLLILHGSKELTEMP
jgi:hypothetical protein